MARWRAILVCATLILWFAGAAWFSSRRQSPTIDEPIEVLAGHAHLHDGDFRFDSDNPPLWKCWAAWPNVGRALPPIRADEVDVGTVAGEAAAQSGSGGIGFAAANRRLFQTPGVDGNDWVQRSRAMMLIVGIALAGLVALWTWQAAREAGRGDVLGERNGFESGPDNVREDSPDNPPHNGANAGPDKIDRSSNRAALNIAAIATIGACALFCFDPNFLAHSALVKADVTVALLATATAWLAWRVGRNATWLNIAGLALVCGLSAVVKYNALVLPLFAAILLIGRTVGMAEPWPMVGRVVARRSTRLLGVVGIGICVAGVMVLVIWASYGFRYAPSSDGDLSLNIRRHVFHLQEVQMGTNSGAPSDRAAIERRRVPLVARAVVWMDAHRLLPQAWLVGLLSIYASSTTVIRQSFLMGELSSTGWWYYFPVAVLVKTPIATLVAIALAAISWAAARWKKDPRATENQFRLRWLMTCLLVPPAGYAIMAMASNVDAGLRHVLPVLPPIYIAAALGIAAMPMRRLRVIGTAVILGLAAESIAAYPNYISFFNAAARPQRLTLLGDSNFDWGQGLKAVAAWQQQNPQKHLYLGYWGTVDPAFYGIRYEQIPGGFPSAATAAPTMLGSNNPPGVLMISATLLQGVNFPPEVRKYYVPLRSLPPDGMIGDCIYLYNWPPSTLSAQR